MSRGYSTTHVVLFCIAAFFAGRFLQLPGLPDAGSGPTIHRSRKSLLQVNPNSGRLLGGKQPEEFLASGANSSASMLSPHFSSFEELLEVSGMLADRPPVPAGVSGHSVYTMQPMQLLSWYPRAYIFPKFMDKARCNHVIEMAEKRLSPSGLALRKGDSVAGTREIRTSQGTFMSRNDDPTGVLAWIEDKIAVLTAIPAGHGEAFNVLRYENMQHYDSHMDSFDEEAYGKQPNQRIATVLVYLSDVEEGGETSFLFEGEDGTERIKTVDYKKCNTGIKYKPRAGDALLFWSFHPDHTNDKHALHGGCPVAVALRLFLAWIGLGDILRSRMEVAAPGLGLDSIANAAFLHDAGSSAALASSSSVPSLLFHIHKATGGHLILAVALSAAADVAGALALQALSFNMLARNKRTSTPFTAGNTPSRESIGSIYLWNPLNVLATVSGSAAPFYCAALAVASWMASSGHPATSGALLALATHLKGPEAALFALPILFIALERRTGKGPRNPRVLVGAVVEVLFAFVTAFGVVVVGATLATSSSSALSTSGSEEALPFTTQTILFITSRLPHMAQVPLKRLLGIGESVGKEGKSPGQRLAWLGALINDDSVVSRTNWLPPFVEESTILRRSEKIVPKLRWAVIQPNIGLQWYLFAEVFPQFLELFTYCFPAIVAALSLSVAVRFVHNPLLVLCAQGAVLCMLGQHPTYSDLGLWLSLLPLLANEGIQLPSQWTGLCLWTGLPVCLALNTAVYQMWLVLGSGNANFFYAMNLLWAGWQAVALLQLLKAGVRKDAATA